jgi:hypothetical protein
MIKKMATNETVPSFVPFEWQGDDNFQLQADDFANLYGDEPVADSSSETVESEGQSYMPPVMQAPLRSLSAYNFFFRDERNRILHGGPMALNPAKQHHLLQEQKHRESKTHGKIDFTYLSKLISKRWKELPEDRRAFYRRAAFMDWERYQTELGQQKTSNTTPNVAPTGSNNFIAIMG